MIWHERELIAYINILAKTAPATVLVYVGVDRLNYVLGKEFVNDHT